MQVRHKSIHITEAEIIAYIQKLEREEMAFKGRPVGVGAEAPKRGDGFLKKVFQIVKLISVSLFDIFLLIWRKNSWKGHTLVFTAPNFCVRHEGEWRDRLAAQILNRPVIYLNQSKQFLLDKIAGQKVYNTGGAVLLLSKLRRFHPDPRINLFYSYRSINDLFLKRSQVEAVTLCFYDLNGLSLAFSRRRSDFALTEIQHGSVLNYPPYAIPAPVAVADTFYVRNARTADYLKQHLCRNFDAVFHLIPYPEYRRKKAPGLHLFYASTIEFNGFHPLFRTLVSRARPGDFELTVRLHPRERGREELFRQANPSIPILFDHSENWLERDLPANTVVISPWSSCIEEACDNGFQSIVLDPVGEKRYRELILAGKCSFAQTPEALQSMIESVAV